MQVVDCQQGSSEWLQARCGIVSASCFAEVLSKGKAGAEAVGRRNLRVRLAIERLTGRPVTGGFQNAATRQGTEREPGGRDAYMVRTGNVVRQVGFVLHDTLETGCSPDGVIEDDGGLELKSPELATHVEYLRRANEPPEYRAQIQGNLWITGRQWWDFASWNPDFPERLQLVIRRVQRDEAYITSLALAVSLFMSEVRMEEAELRALPQAA